MKRRRRGCRLLENVLSRLRGSKTNNNDESDAQPDDNDRSVPWLTVKFKPVEQKQVSGSFCHCEL